LDGIDAVDPGNGLITRQHPERETGVSYLPYFVISSLSIDMAVWLSLEPIVTANQIKS
jgi:hypothetical protein